MEDNSKHPCLYCTAEAQQLAKGQPKTLRSLSNDYQRWKSNSGGDKKSCKDYYNVKNPPLLQDMPNEVAILKITPTPVLQHHAWNI